jgi:hypothetical protein
MKTLHCLQNPKGELLHKTLHEDPRIVWAKGFDIVSLDQGEEWYKKFLYKVDESLESAKALGYKIVKVTLTVTD